MRRAGEADADAILAILEGIAAERIHTAISQPWPVDRQREYLRSLSPRETVYLAETGANAIIGYQTLELWAPTLASMAHVGQIGTFIGSGWRRRGVGEALFRHTLHFAQSHAYAKFVIQVRASNISAQRFYQRLGFRECGRLTRQVRIDGAEDDEILMEYFL